MRPTNQTASVNYRHQPSCRNSEPAKPILTPARRTSPAILTLSVALAASSVSVQAQDWDTVHNVGVEESELGSVRSASGSTSDASGSVFVAGSMRDGFGPTHAVVMKSGDGGETWDCDLSTPDVDDPADIYTSLDGSNLVALAIASARVPNGIGGITDHLVTLGSRSRHPAGPPIPSTWFARRSLDGGATWQTIDEYAHPTYQHIANGNAAVALDGQGNIFTAVTMEESVTKGKTTTKVNHWLVRKGVNNANGTLTWQTSDFAFPAAIDSVRWENVFPNDILCLGNDVFVIGGGGSDGGYWHVIKSSNGGNTWTVADSFRLDGSGLSHAYGIAADSAGNLYVTGTGQRTVTTGRGKTATTSTQRFWLVRKGSSGGTSWSTVDSFEYPSGEARPADIAIDAFDMVYVTGRASSPTISTHWITRQGTGGIWSNSDTFTYPSAGSTAGKSICADPFGNVFATGLATNANGLIRNWLVRRTLAP